MAEKFLRVAEKFLRVVEKFLRVAEKVTVFLTWVVSIKISISNR